MDGRAIGIFDSGLGGLTAVRAVRQLMPEEDIIYFADSGRVPYGSKTWEELQLIAAEDVGFLAAQQVKVIAAACGTVSSNAAEVLKQSPVRAIGLVDCAARALSSTGGKGALGIIATEASLRSGAYESALRALGEEREIICRACPDFVTLIESGHSAPDDAELQKAVEKYLCDMKAAGISALLLGCTHFGIIEESIRAYLGQGVELVSAADSLARELEKYIKSSGLEGGSGAERYYTSGSTERFSRQAELFLGRSILQAEYRTLPEERE